MICGVFPEAIDKMAQLPFSQAVSHLTVYHKEAQLRNQPPRTLVAAKIPIFKIK